MSWMRCPNCKAKGFGDYIIIPSTALYMGNNLVVVVVCQKCDWAASVKPDELLFGSMAPEVDSTRWSDKKEDR